MSTASGEICQLENDTYTVCEVLKPGWAQTSIAGLPYANSGRNQYHQPQLHQPEDLLHQRLQDGQLHRRRRCRAGISPSAIQLIMLASYSDGRQVRVLQLGTGRLTLTESLRSGYIAVKVVSNPVKLNCSNVTNQNFTNQKLYCISGYKLDDCTKTGIAGWRITLNNSTYSTSVNTGTGGKYEFCSLVPGSLHFHRGDEIRLCLEEPCQNQRNSSLHRQPDQPELHQPEALLRKRLQAR